MEQVLAVRLQRRRGQPVKAVRHLCAAFWALPLFLGRNRPSKGLMWINQSLHASFSAFCELYSCISTSYTNTRFNDQAPSRGKTLAQVDAPSTLDREDLKTLLQLLVNRRGTVAGSFAAIPTQTQPAFRLLELMSKCDAQARARQSRQKSVLNQMDMKWPVPPSPFPPSLSNPVHKQLEISLTENTKKREKIE